jgi:hypothetical protein
MSIPDVLMYENGRIIPEHMKYVDYGEQVRTPYHTSRSNIEARAFELQKYGRIGSEGVPYNYDGVKAGDAAILITAFMALVAAGIARYGAIADTVEDLKCCPNNVESAHRLLNEYMMIPGARGAWTTAKSEGINDLGAGGTTTGYTNLGEPYWTSTPRRVRQIRTRGI